MSSLDDLGYTPFFSAQFELLPDREGLTPARISAESHGLYELVGCTATLGELAGKLRGQLRAAERPVSGDWVAVSEHGERATIRHVLDRRTSLVRRAAHRDGVPQAIAANVDVFFIVTSANLELNPRRLERYLSAVWDSGADPVLLLSKLDLVEDPVPLEARLREIAGAAPVVSVSAYTGQGMAELEGLLSAQKTVSFIGSSGVGKSSLANRILGHEQQAIQSIGSEAKGRHTTTRRELLVVPGRGVLIDTPGMREFGMLEDEGGIDSAFPDVAERAKFCRFRDCSHEAEPDCAVVAATETGELSPERLRSYHKLKREVRSAQARQDPVLGANVKRRWKAIHKAHRRSKR
ncbi:MAG TPA: ribosome small subunit-dependent GTPase A [Polyangiaceae bacterium]|nr:ribosome small subunit-dependent GTPase A [Polyangiaceae bacterium]